MDARRQGGYITTLNNLQVGNEVLARYEDGRMEDLEDSAKR
jgi:hypothetical protein